MTHVELAEDVETLFRHIAELRIRTALTQLPVVRTVAQAVAANEGFEPDAIADLKLAVDEACACLINRAVLGATLSCKYWMRGRELHVTATVATFPDGPPIERGFGWHVLRTLTDSVATRHESPRAQPTAQRTSIELVKRKECRRW